MGYGIFGEKINGIFRSPKTGYRVDKSLILHLELGYLGQNLTERYAGGILSPPLWGLCVRVIDRYLEVKLSASVSIQQLLRRCWFAEKLNVTNSRRLSGTASVLSNSQRGLSLLLLWTRQ